VSRLLFVDAHKYLLEWAVGGVHTTFKAGSFPRNDPSKYQIQ
jgi:hypothetical protein